MLSGRCRSLVQRSATECGVSDCDRGPSTKRRLLPSSSCRVMKMNKILHFEFSHNGTKKVFWACGVLNVLIKLEELRQSLL